MVKISGLDKFSNDLDEASRALSALDGELGIVHFDPEDAQSIQLAISQMEQIIDERMGRYLNNPIVGPLVDEMKEKYADAILEKAAEARLSEEN